MHRTRNLRPHCVPRADYYRLPPGLQVHRNGQRPNVCGIPVHCQMCAHVECLHNTTYYLKVLDYVNFHVCIQCQMYVYEDVLDNTQYYPNLSDYVSFHVCIPCQMYVYEDVLDNIRYYPKVYYLVCFHLVQETALVFMNDMADIYPMGSALHEELAEKVCLCNTELRWHQLHLVHRRRRHGAPGAKAQGKPQGKRGSACRTRPSSRPSRPRRPHPRSSLCLSLHVSACLYLSLLVSARLCLPACLRVRMQQ